MPPAPASSTWRSIRSLSAAVKVRRRGRSASSGEAAGDAETTVGLRPPSVSAPPARVFSKWITGMTMGCFDLLPSRVNSRDGLSHHHWHRGHEQFGADRPVYGAMIGGKCHRHRVGDL